MAALRSFNVRGEPESEADAYQQNLDELYTNMGKALEQLDDLSKWVCFQESGAATTSSSSTRPSNNGRWEERKKLDAVLEKFATEDKKLAVDLASMADLLGCGIIEAGDEIRTTAGGETAVKKAFEQIRQQTETNVAGGRLAESIGRAREKLGVVATQGGNNQQMGANEKGKEGEDDEGFEVARVQLSDKDPITKQKIKNPVRNKICGHVYERDSIKQFIADHRKARRLCQCPTTACPNKQALHMDHIEDYPDFFANR